MQLDDLLGSFNAEVLALRQRKADLRELMAAQALQLRQLHRELPPRLHLQPPEPPSLDPDTEYPERQFEVLMSDPPRVAQLWPTGLTFSQTETTI